LLHGFQIIDRLVPTQVFHALKLGVLQTARLLAQRLKRSPDRVKLLSAVVLHTGAPCLTLMNIAIQRIVQTRPHDAARTPQPS
jgi:hypothetical protein